MSHVAAPPPDTPIPPPRPELPELTELTPGAETSRSWSQWLLGGQRLRQSAGVLVSIIVHCTALIVMSLLAVVAQHAAPIALTVTPVEEMVALETPTVAMPDPLSGVSAAEPADLPQAAQTPRAPQVAAPWAAPGPASDARPSLLSELSEPNLLVRRLAASGGGFEGRSQQARARLVGERGGTPQSEHAVGLGLQWLAAHQRDSGGWRLNHQEGPCDSRCRNPGTLGTSTGATGLALLPFLGAGNTSQQGPQREVVRRGIEYLHSRMLDTPHGADLQEGTMYAQGLATIALCENYALTGDPALREPAQRAVDFICHAQHPKGGWRYFPGQPGDTTVFGWQLMALKSARLAGLRVPSPVIEQAKSYLDGVSAADGALYGYLKSGKDPSPTAIGLLSRMYTGWPQDDSRLARGVDFLAALGPSDHDMYFNYYATQVLHHYEGPQWAPWNRKLREMLIRTQATEGHEQGSWYFDDPHGKAGGRLYTTAMCVMILEVYYRHMPLYGRQSVEDF